MANLQNQLVNELSFLTGLLLFLSEDNFKENNTDMRYLNDQKHSVVC